MNTYRPGYALTHEVQAHGVLSFAGQSTPNEFLPIAAQPIVAYYILRNTLREKGRRLVCKKLKYWYALEERLQKFMISFLFKKLYFVIRFCKKKLVPFVELQLFLTTASLPIFAYWGLPISYMSPIGNFLFAPLVSLFLFFSSLIFFTQLVGISPSFLTTMLEYTTRFLVWCVNEGGSKEWLIGSPQPSLGMCLAIIGITFGVMQHRLIQRPGRRIVALGIILGMTLAYFHYHAPAHLVFTTIECGNQSMSLVGTKRGVHLIDFAKVSRISSLDNWIEYTLASHLSQHYGTQKIETVIVTRVNKRILQGLNTLCVVMPVKNVYMVTWQGEAPPRLLRLYGALRRTLESKGGTLHRFKAAGTTVVLEEGMQCKIRPQEGSIVYDTITMPIMKVVLETAALSVDTQPIN